MKTIGLFLISAILISCQSKKSVNSKVSSDSISKCLMTNESDIFDSEYFPFEFKNYNTKKLLKYFKSNVTVDSVEYNNEGFISRIYTFKNKNSEISFFVKINNTNGDDYFYLDNATILNDLMDSKNGIKINMPRKDFFEAIKSTSVSCDTFTLQEGDLATYYYFIFESERLSRIEIRAQE